MNLSFVKMHGAGNDFICIDNRKSDVVLTPENIQFLCNRHFGVGADGVILMETFYDIKNKNVSDIFMNYYNADGTIAEMCGNGVRVTAHFAQEFWSIQTDIIHVETRSGIKQVTVSDNKFCVNMGSVMFEHPQDYIKNKNEAVIISDIEWNFASMGNPHAVGFFNNTQEIEEIIDSLGPEVENRVQYFPNKTNVNFVAPIQFENKIFQVSTFERGAGKTLACGTGASASFAWIIQKYSDLKISEYEMVEIRVPGGTLFFYYDKNKNIFMSGPSEIVFFGKISL